MVTLRGTPRGHWQTLVASLGGGRGEYILIRQSTIDSQLTLRVRERELCLDGFVTGPRTFAGLSGRPVRHGGEVYLETIGKARYCMGRS